MFTIICKGINKDETFLLLQAHSLKNTYVALKLCSISIIAITCFRVLFSRCIKYSITRCNSY